MSRKNIYEAKFSTHQKHRTWHKTHLNHYEKVQKQANESVNTQTAHLRTQMGRRAMPELITGP